MSHDRNVQRVRLCERLVKEAYWVNETSFWKPDPQNRSHIARSGKIQDTEDGLSEFPHVILNQARVHDFISISCAIRRRVWSRIIRARWLT